MTSQSDTLFRILIANAVDGIVVIDARGNILIFNAACERLFGYTQEEVLSRDVNMLMPEPYFSADEEHAARHSSPSGRLMIGIGRDVEGRKKDGTIFPIYISVGEGKLDDERMFIGIIHDLTVYRNAEVGLREREARLSSILETVPDAMVTIDENGLVESFSTAATKLFGYVPSEVVGQNIKMLMPSPYQEQHDGYLAHYKATGERRVIGLRRVVEGRRRDGTTFPMELSVGEVLVGQRRLFTGFAHDITEREKAKRKTQALQAELLQVSRLSAVGQVASTLAHEVNQPLTAIRNYVAAAKNLLRRQNHSVTDVEAILDKAAAQITRAGEIIARQRELGDKRQPVRSEESLNDVVGEAIDLSIVGWAEFNVTVRTDFDPTWPVVSVDKVQIQQVLVNLIRNAVESMQTVPVRRLSITTSPSDSDFVQVAISDSGSGFAQGVAKKLFQPFLTTKANGMGIGLTICREILENHGGRIWAVPNEGPGVTFLFKLRRSHSQPTHAAHYA